MPMMNSTAMLAITVDTDTGWFVAFSTASITFPVSPISHNSFPVARPRQARREDQLTPVFVYTLRFFMMLESGWFSMPSPSLIPSMK